MLNFPDGSRPGPTAMHEPEPTPVDDRPLTPQRFVAIFRRRAPIVLACLLVAVGVELAYSLTAHKQYTATAALVFNNAPLNQQIAGLQTPISSDPQSQQDTNLQLLSLGNMSRETAARVGQGLTASAVRKSMAFSPSGDTTVVEVSSTLPSPALAARVANTYARTFVNEQENAGHQYYQSALRTVDRQIAKLSPRQAKGVQGLDLENRAQSLATLAQVRTGTVSLAQNANVPTSPSAPSVKRNTIVAALLGLLVGIALAFLVERVDQTIRDPTELERAYGLPLLGAVPLSPALKRSALGSTPQAPPAEVADTFQFIRARLRYFNVDRNLHAIAVVSAQPGDGKTTVAHWLANAVASMGSRVLLLEADLRRPTVAQELGLRSGPGLADFLIGSCSFEAATQTVEFDRPVANGGRNRSLDVVTAGALPPNPAEMLESRAMAELLQHAKSTYDVVLIDTPPLGAVSDAMPLARVVDGVVIVAQMGHQRRDAAQRLHATLTSVHAPLLGVIANRIKGHDAAYDYTYTYSSDAKSGYADSYGIAARQAVSTETSVPSDAD